MKIKTDLEFESYSDGICDIYTTDEEGERSEKHRGLGYGNRVMGFKRHFAAAAVQRQINKVIRIPRVSGVEPQDTVELRGIGKYEIELAQIIYDANPPSIDLTLKQLEMFTVTP